MFTAFYRGKCGQTPSGPKSLKNDLDWSGMFTPVLKKLEKVFAGSTGVQGSAAVKLHLPTCEKHTLCAGAEQRPRPSLSWMLCVPTSEAFFFPDTADICIQRLRW